MQLSKLENIVYEKLRENNIYAFRVRDLNLIFSTNRSKAYNIIKALKRKGAIIKVGKGFFAFKDSDEFIIGSIINSPSYISFWTSLNYYGFSDQNPKKIFLATTKQSKEIKRFKYITLSKKRFFGYIKIGEVVIADKEKAIIDSLFLPKYSGGIREIMISIKNSIGGVSIDKLIDYAFKMKSKAVLRRLGYILEELGIKGRIIEKMNKNIGKGYEILDPNLKKKNNLNKKWLLDINIQ